jgi:hypothetical protein
MLIGTAAVNLEIRKSDKYGSMTGEYRFDVRIIKYWFRPDEELVVLQVAYVKWITAYGKDVKIWRDANMSDFRASSL